MVEITSEVYVRSVGSCLPPRMSTRQAVDRGLYEAGDLEFMGLTGTLVAGGDLSPAHMATAAAATALERAGIGSAELDSVIHSSVFQPGPDGWSLPGYILRELGGGNAGVIELRTGCSGMLSAMELAVGQLTGAQQHGSVLLTAADHMGPWLERWPSDVYLPGDAGSAMVLGTADGFARIRSITSGTVPQLERMNRGDEPLHPPGPRGFVDLRTRHASVTEHMADREAAELMAALNTELAERAIAEAGLKAADITRAVYHNMAGFIVDFFLSRIGLSMEQSSWEFGRTVGHLGCSDQAVALEHLLLGGELAPGDHVLLCGASAGFATVCVVLEIVEVPSWPALAVG
ncbi:ketoacyl-ACP synthase III family protein [Streptomyces acidiscabies]|uniref:ketoacyl-ACP synthase III family protein n=1 Tax=Streptomyces acidiscabies TaxID=42234 RepID=UPI00073E87D4|nr:ketoacyl-ACP synthase III family protein [Streptomyces acidiscabies]